MATTKKQFKHLALELMHLLSSPHVDEDYKNAWYHVIACDFVSDFISARKSDYEFAISRLKDLLTE